MRTQLDSVSTMSLGDLQVVESVGRCLAPKLDTLKGRRLIFSRDDRKLVPYDGWGLNGNKQPAVVTTVRPASEKVLVAAVDSSCVKVAETDEGSLFAVKCGIATSISGNALMHFKIGPILFYLTEDSAKESDVDVRLSRTILLDDEMAMRLVRIRAERAIQFELASHLAGALILVDGSLRTSIFEERRRSLNKIAEECAMRLNTLVGISKGTKFKSLERAAAPLSNVPGPAFIEVDIIVKNLVKNLLGSNYMIRLDAAGPVMRADVIGGNGAESLGRLVGNDSISAGYPETLRLAHHISSFVGTELTCLRSHILRNYDVVELAAQDVRRTVLGSISV